MRFVFILQLIPAFFSFRVSYYSFSQSYLGAFAARIAWRAQGATARIITRAPSPSLLLLPFLLPLTPLPLPPPLTPFTLLPRPPLLLPLPLTTTRTSQKSILLPPSLLPKKLWTTPRPFILLPTPLLPTIPMQVREKETKYNKK